MFELSFETGEKLKESLKLHRKESGIYNIWRSMFSFPHIFFNSKCYKLYLTSIYRNVIVLFKKKNVSNKHPHLGETLLTFLLNFYVWIMIL